MAVRRPLRLLAVGLLLVTSVWGGLVVVSAHLHQSDRPTTSYWATSPTNVHLDPSIPLPPYTQVVPDLMVDAPYELPSVAPDDAVATLALADDARSVVRSGDVPAGLPGLSWAIRDASGELRAVANADADGSFTPDGTRPVTVVLTQFEAGHETAVSNEVDVLDPCVG